MLRQMNDQAAARYLQVDRRIFRSVFPVDFKTKPVNVELLGSVYHQKYERLNASFYLHVTPLLHTNSIVGHYGAKADITVGDLFHTLY